jgi:glycosyltransferase involved in cell wall biosynthesis
MNNELVSTIIPVFNRARMLCEAVDSVLCQTYRPIEIIIVDDGSTDETPDVADHLQAQNPSFIDVLHIRNSGPGIAREAGRRAAKGAYIQYLDSDDLLLPEKFSLQIAGLISNPDCAISYCKTRYRDSTGNLLDDAWKRTGEHIESLFPSMLLGRWWGTSTPLYRRSAVDDVGPWSDLSNEEDWEYDCRFAANGVTLHYVPETLTEERGYADNSLSKGGSSEPNKLASRAKAHEMVYKHAVAAGIANSSLEMRHFSRSLFLLSRQCGAAGLAEASKRLFHLSRKAADSYGHLDIDYFVYGVGAKLLGWRLMGMASHYFDRVRSSF